MKVWFDGQCLQTASRLRGIGRYAQELIRALSERGDIDLSISFNAAMPDEALAARDVISAWIAPRDIHVWESPRENGEAISGYTDARRLGQIALSHHVACLGVDVAVSTSPFEGHGDAAMPLEPSPLLGCPLASIFYDAIPYRYPDRYLRDPNLRSSYNRRLEILGRYDLNLCISEYSTREATAIVGRGNHVNISAGVSPDFLHLLAMPLMPTPPGPYVLYVGGLDWRKNVIAIVEAFGRLAGALRASTRLVLAGDHPSELLKDIARRWQELGLRPDMLVLSAHVSDLELVSLYRAAAVVVQPSYLEGFGLTALEAMRCGAPVIVADRGAAPEVVQDRELMFDPDDHDRLAALIARMIEDSSFAAAAVEAGRIRAETFTWDRSAQHAHAALKGLVKSKHDAPPSLEARRRAALAAIRQEGLQSTNVAEILARAEPLDFLPPRLLIDCTATLRNDGGTGIQRVTREISRRMSATADATILFGDDQISLQPVSWLGSRPIRPIEPTGDRAYFIRPNDTVFMLDSSWEFHESHLLQLMSARLRGTRVISMMHDLVPMLTPAFCNEIIPPIFKKWLASALAYSTGFICNSRTTAEELLALLQALNFPRPMKIGYFLLGADLKDVTRPARSRPPSQGYRFLMVGTIEPRKGYDVALAGFEALWTDSVDAELTIIGRAGWSTERLMERIRSHPEYGRRLHLLQGIPDEDLIQAYADTDALIASSYTEGFGLPVVEARHFGKPVIVSDIPVFREVTEGAENVLFFAPGDSSLLADAVRRFIGGEGRGPVEDNTGFAWPDWDESARLALRVVRDGEWQMEYRPKDEHPYASAYDIGETRMLRLLGPGERDHSLNVLSIEILDDGTARLRVRVTNLSETVWSSNLEDGERLGFALTARSLSVLGAPIGVPTCTAIPLILPAGQSIILTVTVPSGCASVELEAGQDGKGWGNVLRVPIL
ncbi:glycosyltransferase family 4 protein [Methylobacterium sp. CM6247]